jgi:hypothetical protein
MKLHFRPLLFVFPIIFALLAPKARGESPAPLADAPTATSDAIPADPADAPPSVVESVSTDPSTSSSTILSVATGVSTSTSAIQSVSTDLSTSTSTSTSQSVSTTDLTTISAQTEPEFTTDPCSTADDKKGWDAEFQKQLLLLDDEDPDVRYGAQQWFRQAVDNNNYAFAYFIDQEIESLDPNKLSLEQTKSLQKLFNASSPNIYSQWVYVMIQKFVDQTTTLQSAVTAFRAADKEAVPYANSAQATTKFAALLPMFGYDLVGNASWTVFMEPTLSLTMQNKKGSFKVRETPDGDFATQVNKSGNPKNLVIRAPEIEERYFRRDLYDYHGYNGICQNGPGFLPIGEVHYDRGRVLESSTLRFKARYQTILDPYSLLFVTKAIQANPQLFQRTSPKVSAYPQELFYSLK